MKFHRFSFCTSFLSDGNKEKQRLETLKRVQLSGKPLYSLIFWHEVRSTKSYRTPTLFCTIINFDACYDCFSEIPCIIHLLPLSPGERQIWPCKCTFPQRHTPCEPNPCSPGFSRPVLGKLLSAPRPKWPDLFTPLSFSTLEKTLLLPSSVNDKNAKCSP